MNLVKSLDYINPNIKEKINIIGCGSVGSTVAENLARCGFKNFNLFDFDKVESKNIVNQMFLDNQAGMLKTEALMSILESINPEIKEKTKLYNKGWNGEQLTGYIFLCVDNIDIRKEICKKFMYSTSVKAVFDFRTALESAQHFSANWKSNKEKQNLLNTMNFTHEEAQAEEQLSACGTTLGVASTVRLISALGVNNFINFLKNKELKNVIVIDGFNMFMEAF